MGSQAKALLKDQTCGTKVLTENAGCQKDMALFEPVNSTVALDALSQCFKCEGKKINKKGLECKKCKGSGKMGAKFTEEIRTIVNTEVKNLW